MISLHVSAWAFCCCAVLCIFVLSVYVWERANFLPEKKRSFHSVCVHIHFVVCVMFKIDAKL